MAERGPGGPRVAAGLRELLRDPARAPVLVLATLWPAHWNTLTTRTTPNVHAQARVLLDGHAIPVPGAFTGADLAALTELAAGDPRLEEAAERAGDGQVTQYLAGVPVLMDRYRQASTVPATQALIHAAMDARRLGCGPPPGAAGHGRPGYLTGVEWEQAGQDWLKQAPPQPARRPHHRWGPAGRRRAGLLPRPARPSPPRRPGPAH
uniref:hypothetical protein n=1 Tax=Herbidospora sakaeratensis TaxID=564415 RepID=UPI000A48A0F1|nr:hypothetical protein [Herbidospora sakaeratensis]